MTLFWILAGPVALILAWTVYCFAYMLAPQATDRFTAPLVLAWRVHRAWRTVVILGRWRYVQNDITGERLVLRHRRFMPHSAPIDSAWMSGAPRPPGR
jgi:hypothetical protein